MQNALASVTVSTGSSGTQSGDITLASDFGWSANTTLTLAAASNIALNGNIIATGANAGLVLNSGISKDYTLIRSMAELDAINGISRSGHYASTQFTCGQHHLQ